MFKRALLCALVCWLSPLRSRATTIYAVNYFDGTLHRYVDGVGPALVTTLPHQDARGMVMDGAGNLLISTENVNDTPDNIWKVAPDGTTSVFATLSSPGWLALDGSGNLYASSFFNSTITKVTLILKL